MSIQFSLPLLDDPVVAEVVDCLTGTGWITSGPKLREFEQGLSQLTGTPVLGVNSWTSGAMVLLRWLGVGPGDEVIVPAYTYAATALAAMNLGAEVVMVDVDENTLMDPSLLAAAITPRTKAVIPVDLGGLPADTAAIMAIVDSPEVRAVFTPRTDAQRALGRPLVLVDAAHSIGGSVGGVPVGALGDATVFSFHSVKNVTCGEGGAVCLALPAPFDNDAELTRLRALALNGQNKSAFEKNQVGGWRYDIVDQGLKVNLNDVSAAIGLAQLRRYESELLPERRELMQRYRDGFADAPWADLAPSRVGDRVSSDHLAQLRVLGIDEAARDRIIQRISAEGIGVNVHYIPMAMLTLFRTRGYNIADYPTTYARYATEISLPLYNRLGVDNVDRVVEVVKAAVAAELQEVA